MSRQQPVLTVTLNPAVDYLTTVNQLVPGTEHRVGQMKVSAGGKGINVARALLSLGLPVTATGLIGGTNGELLESTLSAEGIPYDFLRVSVATRQTFSILDQKSGMMTRALEDGPRVGRVDLQRFMEQAPAFIRNSAAVVFSGSLPPGAPQEFYGPLIRMANSLGRMTVLDTSAEALRLGLRARPSFVKPNLAEAKELLGQAISGGPKLKAAVVKIHSMGAGGVLLSLGPDGLVGSDGQNIWWAVPPKVKVVQTIGCGDALAAGFVSAWQSGVIFPEALRFAVAVGTANTLTLQPGRFSRKAVTLLARKVKLSPL